MCPRYGRLTFPRHITRDTLVRVLVFIAVRLHVGGIVGTCIGVRPDVSPSRSSAENSRDAHAETT